jgi:hypothetical protein
VENHEKSGFDGLMALNGIQWEYFFGIWDAAG